VGFGLLGFAGFKRGELARGELAEKFLLGLGSKTTSLVPFLAPCCLVLFGVNTSGFPMSTSEGETLAIGISGKREGEVSSIGSCLCCVARKAGTCS
jgi:hypothetical protein